MGRRPWTLRLVVEDCRCLSATELGRTGVFRSHPGAHWQWKWTGIDGKRALTLGFTVVEVPGRALGLRLDYSVGDCSISRQTVQITTTTLYFGGLRHWFLCPMVRDGIKCGSRVGRLYLPTERQVFGCRLCYWLTYASCQQHDARKDALLRNPPALLLAVQSTNRPRRLLALGALQSLQKS